MKLIHRRHSEIEIFRGLLFWRLLCSGRALLQHVELAEVSVDESSFLKHFPHVLYNLQVELTSLRLRQRRVLQQWSWPNQYTTEINAWNVIINMYTSLINNLSITDRFLHVVFSNKAHQQNVTSEQERFWTRDSCCLQPETQSQSGSPEFYQPGQVLPVTRIRFYWVLPVNEIRFYGVLPIWQFKFYLWCQVLQGCAWQFK